MSSLIPSGGASGTGSVTLLAPNTNSTQTITLPDSTGTVLTTGSPQSGGVIQVVNVAYSTTVSSSSSTYADTGLTASITPKFSTSKILVMVEHNGCRKDSSNTNLQTILLRNGSQISGIDGAGGFTNTTATNDFGGVSISYLDSPATTSSTTYKTQFKSQNNSATVYVNNVNGGGATQSTMTLMEIAA